MLYVYLLSVFLADKPVNVQTYFFEEKKCEEFIDFIDLEEPYTANCHPVRIDLEKNIHYIHQCHGYRAV